MGMDGACYDLRCDATASRMGVGLGCSLMSSLTRAREGGESKMNYLVRHLLSSSMSLGLVYWRILIILKKVRMAWGVVLRLSRHE